MSGHIVVPFFFFTFVIPFSNTVNTTSLSYAVPIWPQHTWYSITVYARNSNNAASPATTGSFSA